LGSLTFTVVEDKPAICELGCKRPRCTRGVAIFGHVAVNFHCFGLT